jgi:hypothetical protein
MSKDSVASPALICTASAFPIEFAPDTAQ